MLPKKVNCTFKIREEELKTIDLVAFELLMTRSEFIRYCLKTKLDEHLSTILKGEQQCN